MHIFLNIVLHLDWYLGRIFENNELRDILLCECLSFPLNFQKSFGLRAVDLIRIPPVLDLKFVKGACVHMYSRRSNKLWPISVLESFFSIWHEMVYHDLPINGQGKCSVAHYRKDILITNRRLKQSFQNSRELDVIYIYMWGAVTPVEMQFSKLFLNTFALKKFVVEKNCCEAISSARFLIVLIAFAPIFKVHRVNYW